MGPKGALPLGARAAADLPSVDLRFREVTFAYPADPDAVVLDR